MAYNYDKTTCDICGITKKELEKNPTFTGRNYPYEYSRGFQLGYDGSALCWTCHKEKQLGELMALIDIKKGSF